MPISISRYPVANSMALGGAGELSAIAAIRSDGLDVFHCTDYSFMNHEWMRCNSRWTNLNRGQKNRELLVPIVSKAKSWVKTWKIRDLFVPANVIAELGTNGVNVPPNPNPAKYLPQTASICNTYPYGIPSEDCQVKRMDCGGYKSLLPKTFRVAYFKRYSFCTLRAFLSRLCPCS